MRRFLWKIRMWRLARSVPDFELLPAEWHPSIDDENYWTDAAREARAAAVPPVPIEQEAREAGLQFG